MEKNNMIQSIVSKLERIGIYPKIGQEADIEIAKEFLDSKFSTGEKKIIYTSSALFDDASKILYYYENTKEESKGFSFGSDNESSFQSGTTLFRKIKSVGYAPDGNAYEYEIDIGQIAKIFKEVAKENDWKFKIVLSSKKAKYRVIVAKANMDNIDEADKLKQLDKEYIQNKGNDNTTKIKILDKIKNIGLIYIIGIILSIIYLIILNANLLGWIITAIIFIFLILKRQIIEKKSLVKRIFSWILIFIIIFFVGAFTMSDNYNTDNNGSQNNNVENTKNEKTPFYITSESYIILNGYEYVAGSDSKQIKPSTSASILIAINSSNLEQNDEVKSITIKNAKVTKAPKMGTPEFYFYDFITENSENETSEKHLFKNNSFEYSIEDFNEMHAVQFYYGIKDIKTQDVSSWSVIESDKAIAKSGVKSDDVRSTITFEIEITTVNNKKYSKIFSQEIFKGDFIQDPTAGYISKYYNNDDIIYFQVR